MWAVTVCWLLCVVVKEKGGERGLPTDTYLKRGAFYNCTRNVIGRVGGAGGAEFTSSRSPYLILMPF